MRQKETLIYKVSVYILSVIVIVLLQTTVVEYIKIKNVKPNFVLVYTVCASILEGSVGGGLIGLFAGLVQDILAGKIFGFYGLLGMYLGVIAGMSNRRLYKENILVVIFFTFFLTLIYEYTVYILGNFGQKATSIFYIFKNILFIEAIYNAGLSIIINIFVRSINDRFSNGRKTLKY